jgi:hypothetical protein
MRTRVVSDVAIEALHLKLTKALNVPCVIASLDVRRLLLWTLNPADYKTLVENLTTEEPLRFSAVDMITPDGLAKTLKGSKVKNSLTIDVAVFQGRNRALILDQWTASLAGRSVEGVWWVCDENSVWQSSAGPADVNASAALHGLSRRSYTQRLWIDPSLQRVSKQSDRYWILHPHGEILAIFQVKSKNQETQRSLSNLCSQIIANRMSPRLETTQEISPEIFHWIKAASLDSRHLPQLKFSEAIFDSEVNLPLTSVWTKTGHGTVATISMTKAEANDSGSKVSLFHFIRNVGRREVRRAG